jgi:hypothetical protein
VPNHLKVWKKQKIYLLVHLPLARRSQFIGFLEYIEVNRGKIFFFFIVTSFIISGDIEREVLETFGEVCVSLQYLNSKM